MYKFGKAIAVALAATMVFGSAVTSFASEPVTSVNSEGNGTSEGHVEKKTIDITLPTVASGSTPFAYIMDPERLITETEAAKYANTVWPTSNDTGVYFNQGAISGGDNDGKTQYGNTSIVTTVTNKSSSALNITIKAEAVSADTDIPLVAKDAITTASAASLYLGLAYDDKDSSTTDTPVAIAKDTAAEKTVSVAGTPANYKVAYNSTDSKYEYRALTLAEYQALSGNSDKTQADYDATWATMEFNLEGAVTSGKAVTATTTAPKVKVTWSWADPEANAAPSISPTSYTMTADQAIDVSFSYGAGDLGATSITSITYKNASGVDKTMATTDYNVANGKISVASSVVNNLLDNNIASRTYTVTFDNDATATFTFVKE